MRVWFARGVGLVRFFYRRRNEEETDIQLVDYTITEPSESRLPLAIGNRWHYRWTAPQRGMSFEAIWKIVSYQDVPKARHREWKLTEIFISARDEK